MSGTPIDARYAWQRMTGKERADFLRWIASGYGTKQGAAPGVWLCGKQFYLIDSDDEPTVIRGTPKHPILMPRGTLEIRWRTEDDDG